MKMQGRKSTVYIINTAIAISIAVIMLIRNPELLVTILVSVFGFQSFNSLLFISTNLLEKFMRLKNFYPELIESKDKTTGK